MFAAEWGDVTQVGTAALVARTPAHPWQVIAGATLGLWTGAALAVGLGRTTGRWLNPWPLQRVAARPSACSGFSPRFIASEEPVAGGQSVWDFRYRIDRRQSAAGEGHQPTVQEAGALTMLLGFGGAMFAVSLIPEVRVVPTITVTDRGATLGAAGTF